jgi:hypothetical protein
VSTPGTLSGTFKGLPHGTLASITCGSAGTYQVPVRIGYTANAAIATLLYNSTTTLEYTRAAGATGSVKANEPVTLVAIVTQPTGTPAGTVRFADEQGSVFSGCESRPVSLVAGRYQATCEGASFATQYGKPTATFRSATFEVADSKSGPTSIYIDKTMAHVTVTASSPPKVGEVVTYTATVTADPPGPAVPSAGGTVAFGYMTINGLVTFPDCAAMPTTATATGITATCTRRVPDANQLYAAARWVGDGNFHASLGGLSSGEGAFVGGIPNFGGPFQPPALDDVAKALSARLAPSGASARIKSILKNGGFVYEFITLGPGELQVTWTYRPPTARAAAKAKPFVVAKGLANTTPLSKSKVKVKLTAKGRKLLKRSKKLRLTARVGFDPGGPSPATTVKKVITLKR